MSGEGGSSKGIIVAVVVVVLVVAVGGVVGFIFYRFLSLLVSLLLPHSSFAPSQVHTVDSLF